MKSLPTLVAGLAILLAFSACKKEATYEMYTYYKPVFKTKAEVRADIKSGVPISIKNPGKIYVRGNYVFLNDIDKGIHIIDYSNPASPVNKGFVAIPGCRDIAVKDNYMYADCFTDLVTIHIADANNVQLKNYISNVFPHRASYYGDTSKIVVDWERVDTMVRKGEGIGGCWDINYSLNNPVAMNSGSTGGGEGAGVGGSMAAFALLNDRLYTVDNATLKVFNTTNAASLQYVTEVSLGSWMIETIYPFKNNLFIGSQNGMMIYSAATPDAPVLMGSFSHATMCDPVIADGTTAYVTLRSDGMCPGNDNQMDVLDIQNIMSPQLVRTYPLHAPKGLSKDGNNLLVCDGTAGLKMFDASSASNITQKAVLRNIDAYDVIALNGTAIVSASDGIYFVGYNAQSGLSLKGKILRN
jgi:hypothetical protein